MFIEGRNITYHYLTVSCLPTRLQEALEARNDVGEYYFLLGKVYWHLKKDSAEYAKKAHANFLKVLIVFDLHV